MEWIDELFGTRDDVEADVAVAVSSSGFSKPAQNLAKARGIRMRTVESLTPEDLSGWLKVGGVFAYWNQWTVTGVEIGIAPTVPQLGRIAQVPYSTPIFRDVEGELLSTEDIARRLIFGPEAKHLWEGLTEQRQPRAVRLLGSPDVPFDVQTDVGFQPVSDVLITVDMWTERQEALITKMHQYSGRSEQPVQRAEYSTTHKGAEFVMSVTRVPGQGAVV